jgi:hypothetical protein
MGTLRSNATKEFNKLIMDTTISAHYRGYPFTEHKLIHMISLNLKSIGFALYQLFNPEQYMKSSFALLLKKMVNKIKEINTYRKLLKHGAVQAPANRRLSGFSLSSRMAGALRHCDCVIEW